MLMRVLIAKRLTGGLLIVALMVLISLENDKSFVSCESHFSPLVFVADCAAGRPRP